MEVAGDRRVDRFNDAGVDGDDAVHRLIDHPADPLHRVPDFRFRQLDFSDVPNDFRGADDRSLEILQRKNGQGDDDPLACVGDARGFV
jgi:hypothetical protein